MSPRLLTDTCSALKLLLFGDRLFKKGALPSGDLILHPRVFQETARWDSLRKTQFKTEFEAMQSVRSTPGLKPPSAEAMINEKIIKTVRDRLGLSVGNADIEQLNAAMHHDFKIVTNDKAFRDLASELEVEVFSAEQILIEAINVAPFPLRRQKQL